MPSTTPVYISKTYGEWEVIDDKILKSKKNTLSGFLQSEINTLYEKFKNCPDCVTPGWGKMEKRRPRIHKDQIWQLQQIAKKMGITPNQVMTRLIIDPLLLPQ